MDEIELAIKQGREEGILSGISTGSQEGWELGLESGRKLGSNLGVMLCNLLALVNRDGKTDRLIKEILGFPLDNNEDPEKDARLSKMDAKYKEIMMLKGIKSSATKKDLLLDF